MFGSELLRNSFQRMHEFLNVKFLCGTIYKSGVLLSILWSALGNVTIQLRDGLVRGCETDIGPISIYTFKHIPYAKPPVGNLRFERPTDPEPWISEGCLKSYDEQIVCPQFTKNNAYGQEDCLLLDVYMRKNSPTEALLPVLIYFHGGKFSSGSKEEYHPDYLLSFHDIIVVIPNYRLGILGFIHSGNSDIPGNLGLWDQRKSMEWVYDNIESFAGDKNRVTIAGHDAGGASVGFHILSPLSHRFFSAAISASGTALDPWVFNHPSKPTLSQVVEKIGCSQNESNEISCLKRIDIDNILRTQKDLEKIHFSPVVDGPLKHSFLSETPHKLYQFGIMKNVSYLAGVTKNEAFIEIEKHFPEAEKHKHLDSIIQYLLRPYMKKLPEFHMIAKAAKYQYLRGAVIKAFPDIKPQMEMMMSDFLYNSPLLKTLNLHSMTTSNTYMYVFNFKDERSSHGVPHMSDAFYLFNKTFEDEMLEDNKTEIIRKILCDVWGNFIKLQSPGNDSVWQKFKGKYHTNYVEVSDTLSHKMNYRKEATEFWNLLVPDLKYYLNLPTIDPSTKSFWEDSNTSAWGFAGISVIVFVLCVAIVGVVTVAQRRIPYSSILPISSSREHVKYSTVE